MNYKFLSEVDQKIVKEAYKLYLDSYLNWGNSTPLNFDEFKESYTKSNDYEPSLAFFVDKKFIGYGLIMSNYMQNKRLDIGYSVVKSERNKGYATQIIKLLLEFADSKYSPNLICADTFENLASEKVLIKNGFVECGEIPNFNLATGKARSVKFFYILRKNEES